VEFSPGGRAPRPRDAGESTRCFGLDTAQGLVFAGREPTDFERTACSVSATRPLAGESTANLAGSKPAPTLTLTATSSLTLGDGGDLKDANGEMEDEPLSNEVPNLE